MRGTQIERFSSVVSHVLGRRGELGVRLDDLVDGVEEVLLRGHLPPAPDGEHPGFRAHRPDLGARRVGAQPRQQLVPGEGTV